MDDVEARVRCLEMASALCGRTLDNSVDSVVEIAMVFYAFVQTPLQEEKPVALADKPKRGRPPKVADLLE